MIDIISVWLGTYLFHSSIVLGLKKPMDDDLSMCHMAAVDVCLLAVVPHMLLTT